MEPRYAEKANLGETFPCPETLSLSSRSKPLGRCSSPAFLLAQVGTHVASRFAERLPHSPQSALGAGFEGRLLLK